MEETIFKVPAKPYAFSFPREHTALVVIDMQRDFLLDQGFGAISQGNDLTPVQATISPIKDLLDLFRSLDMTVVHTREGHLPDLSDCPSSKLLRNLPVRQDGALKIGDDGPLGRLLVRGEYGHDIVTELAPLPSEAVIDKPGKGAFWNTDLMDCLRARAVTHLIVCGVTTECCFATTIREANDRGFECCGVVEATAGYEPDFKESSLRMLDFAGGLFGFTASIEAFRNIKTDLEDPELLTNGSAVNGKGKHSWQGDMSIESLTSYYKSGGSVTDVVNAVYDKIEAYAQVDPAVWISLEPRANALKAAAELESKYPSNDSRPPLYGIPFSVKDSLDVAGVPTTAACPPISYTPSATSKVCQLILEAGGLYIGKVNLDQFATGLTGCRSPYGTTHSTYSPKFISGGSSSGSAVSVAAGLCSFAIATDTAGSGRVPAGFNGVVGFKPTPGTVSTVGLLPACPSLDCIALMATSVQDARKVWCVVAAYDAEDPYAKWAASRPRPVHALGQQAKRFRFGVPPPEVLGICCPVYQRKFIEACAALESIGGLAVPGIDWSPFAKAGALLYDGTFVSERLATLPDGWIAANKDQLHPAIVKLFESVESRQSSAVQAYRDMMAKARYTREAEGVFRAGDGGIDVLVVPTTPVHWTIREVEESPLERNSVLGTFTHFGNILDLCAVACPAGEYDAAELGEERCPEESRGDKLPFGVTFLGMSGTDAEILEIARRFGQQIAT